jgi:two-component system, NarL family, nitrate/nitrite response regulator NarL
MANSEKRDQQLKRILERLADSFLEISDEEISKQDIEAAWGNAEEAEHVRAILRSAVEVGRDSAPQAGQVELNDTLAHANAQVRPLDDTVRVPPSNATAMIQGQGEIGKELAERAIQSKSMAAGSQDRPLIDVLIGDKNHLCARLLGDALSRDRGLRVIGTTGASRKFLELAAHCTPHVAILSETFDEDSNLGTATLRQFHASYPHVPVIILLESYEREVVVEPFWSGARGIFSRQDSVANLCKCVRAVHEGQIWANSREVRCALEVLTSATRAVSAARLNMLSKREQEVVQHLAKGLTNREIGSRMGLSQLTVKNYLFGIFDKLGVSNRVELLSLALQPSAGHPAGTNRKENSVMRGVAVAILTEDREQQLHIQNSVEATGVARIVFSHLAFPLSATDAIIRQIQDQRTEVVVVDLHAESLQRALDAIALIQNTTSDIAIFAMGEISNPTNIVAAMRAGAREYVDRQADNKYWLDAFARFAAARTKKHVRDGIDGTGGSTPPGESAPPAVPVLSPRSGGPLTLPPRKAEWET